MTRAEEVKLAEVVIRSTYGVQALLPLLNAEAGRKNMLVERLRWENRQLRFACQGVDRGELQAPDIAQFVALMRVSVNKLRSRNVSKPLA